MFLEISTLQLLIYFWASNVESWIIMCFPYQKTGPLFNRKFPKYIKTFDRLPENSTNFNLGQRSPISYFLKNANYQLIKPPPTGRNSLNIVTFSFINLIIKGNYKYWTDSMTAHDRYSAGGIDRRRDPALISTNRIKLGIQNIVTS